MKTAINQDYVLPAKTQIGHVHLKVSDLHRSLIFYRDLLGFELTATYGKQAAFLSAGGYHHHIGLNTWFSLNGVELYTDRPKDQWEYKPDGSLTIFTRPLDLDELLSELDS